MKFAVCQLPTNLAPHHPEWADFNRRVETSQADLVVLNEMPFGPWVASRASYDKDLAAGSVEAHELALAALRKLPAAVIGSRPIRGRFRLCNEAFLLADGNYRPIHHKQYFPQQEGFFEKTWFASERPGFDVIRFRELRVGVLLCTELMFTEWARHYRRQGAHVIVSPRASGSSRHRWDAAACMAAIVSGCYVLSSNRVCGGDRSGPRFGGHGFAYSPTGELLGNTSVAAPLLTVNIDLEAIEKAQRNYPCNVSELDSLRA